jgi:phosphatidylinositol alpha-1,6-mannosyltransferase
MTRTLAHSLNAICAKHRWAFKLQSLYDTNNDLMTQYVPPENFHGFNNQRLSFILKSVFSPQKPHIVILSHVNLALIGLIIKLFSPKTKIWLIAHGIEVWRPLSFNKKRLLEQCSKVICVSNFTKTQMETLHKTDPAKCVVLNNALDPFMKLPVEFEKPEYLLQRYGLNNPAPVIFTLTRLASTELYKGHDMVIKAIGKLKHKFPGIKYILAGKYDENEGIRVKQLIADNGVEDNVILTGFIQEQELPDHFLMADVFVLPSKKEGFGIVFIEALACGLPVICGNADGSVDAIRNGELGEAINTDSVAELEIAITAHLNAPLTREKRIDLKDRCLGYFNEETYIDKLEKMLIND